jgi:hypothetical protein
MDARSNAGIKRIDCRLLLLHEVCASHHSESLNAVEKCTQPHDLYPNTKTPTRVFEYWQTLWAMFAKLKAHSLDAKRRLNTWNIDHMMSEARQNAQHKHTLSEKKAALKPPTYFQSVSKA